VRRYFESAVFVSLSRYEAYGICVAEALAAKTPCIVAADSALREWIDGKNCLGIADPSQKEQLATLINSIMGKEADYSELRSWTEVAEMTIKVYNGEG
jgi:glycosyltransferase involved in cell wall biosynthesis